MPGLNYKFYSKYGRLLINLNAVYIPKYLMGNSNSTQVYWQWPSHRITRSYVTEKKMFKSQTKFREVLKKGNECLNLL